MNSVWQQLTLANLSVQQWSQSSYVHHVVGMLRSWRQGSWLMRWAEPIAALLITSVFVLAPFVSTSLIGILLAACAGFWVLLTLSDEANSGTGLTPIHLLVLLYWGVAVVATALSPVRTAALDGLIKLTLYLLLFVVMARVFRSPRLRSSVITAYLLVTAVVSVAGLRQWFFGADALATWVDTQSTLAGTTRVYSYLGNPNLLAGYLIPAAVFSAAAVFAWRNWLPKLLALTLWVVNSACLVLTFSRGGWIGFVVAGFTFLLLLIHWFSVHLPRFWRIWAVPVVLGLSAAVVVFAVSTLPPLRDRVASIFVGRGDSSNNFRLNVWMAVIEMIKDHPFLGIGPGNVAFNRVYPNYQQVGYNALSAYSVFLEILVETGTIGLLCFLWLLLTTLSLGWQRLQAFRKLRHREGFWLMAAVATLIGMLAHGMVDTVWYRPQVSTLWWMTMAVITSYYVASVPEPLPGEPIESSALESLTEVTE